MKQRTFVIGRGFVEAETPESIAAGWDRAFAAVRAQGDKPRTRVQPHEARTAAAWDAAFARVAAQRTGRL
ncbi:hypothetical protein [Paraburkholderia unamae]|uniref:Uncharacterized protein n=1 Tax=Paraburkholderia unamae TaxID=219649 RepID=A0ABX5KPE1_9BURK|nr:hypothetical protein [Paraburkholderia unamae]PVX81247.1 hypothetical protein C7402_111149 [Paraburkholderia unamae]CAG9245215.1 hypothetical protein PUN4_1050006 [Paraburkholderia unamae]